MTTGHTHKHITITKTINDHWPRTQTYNNYQTINDHWPHTQTYKWSLAKWATLLLVKFNRPIWWSIQVPKCTYIFVICLIGWRLVRSEYPNRTFPSLVRDHVLSKCLLKSVPQGLICEFTIFCYLLKRWFNILLLLIL